jgi:hypothetical protein
VYRITILASTVAHVRMTNGPSTSYSDWLSLRDQPQVHIDGCAARRAVALKRPIFKRKKGFANLSLGLIYHSKAFPQPPSRDTIPLKQQRIENFVLVYTQISLEKHSNFESHFFLGFERSKRILCLSEKMKSLVTLIYKKSRRNCNTICLSIVKNIKSIILFIPSGNDSAGYGDPKKIMSTSV